MTSVQDNQPKRVCFKREEVDSLTKEQIIEKWFQQDKYIDFLETKPNEAENSELVSLRESEEKLKQQQLEATRRENILVMRLTTKEQEMQEYANQIQELKQGQIPTVAQLRSALLDPAVNLMFERLRKELESIKARLEETQNELSAWKFTPDSNTGKRLMAKCRLLYQENEELGKMISSGRMAKLEGDLALQRNFSEEMKKSQNELDDFLLELDEDVEGMQNTIYYLQQQLKESKDHISRLQQEKQKLSSQVLKDNNTSIRTASPVSVIVKNENISDVLTNGKDSPENHNPSKEVGTANITHSEEQPEVALLQVKTEREGSFQDTSGVLSLEVEMVEVSTEETLSLGPTKAKNPEENAQELARLDAAKPEGSLTNETNSAERDDAVHVKEEDTSIISDSDTARSSTPPLSVESRATLKRTRDSLDESDVTQSPKRPKENGDSSPPRKGESPADVDTDTEVQVAEMLVCWATANKGRIESQSPQQTCQTVGNGELEDGSS